MHKYKLLIESVPDNQRILMDLLDTPLSLARIAAAGVLSSPVMRLTNVDGDTVQEIELDAELAQMLGRPDVLATLMARLRGGTELQSALDTASGLAEIAQHAVDVTRAFGHRLTADLYDEVLNSSAYALGLHLPHSLLERGRQLIAHMSRQRFSTS